MADRTGIEWTDATWNPVTGCTKVSPGCDHCYAETIAHRFDGTPAYPHGFQVTLRPERLDQPLRWRRPRRIFVNSMSDLFHDQVPDQYIARIFAVMANAPRHTFQILTKRHGRMRSLLNSDAFKKLFDIEWCRIPDWAPRLPDPDFVQLHHLADGPLPNVWLGVSVESQQWADIRVPALLGTPAAVRFLSMEPLLGPVDIINGLGDSWLTGIDWIIVGGESGRGARPMHPDWVRSLLEQCDVAGVPFLFKQWGEWAPSYQLRSERAIPPGPNVYAEHLIHTDLGVIRMHRVGKKAAGRELDGRTWDEFPEAAVS